MNESTTGADASVEMPKHKATNTHDMMNFAVQNPESQGN